jgi:hypothetical protein
MTSPLSSELLIFIAQDLGQSLGHIPKPNEGQPDISHQFILLELSGCY